MVDSFSADRITAFYDSVFRGVPRAEFAPETYLRNCIKLELLLRKYFDWSSDFARASGEMPTNQESRARLEELVIEQAEQVDRQSAETLNMLSRMIRDDHFSELIQTELESHASKKRPFLRELSVEFIGIIMTPVVILVFILIANLFELNFSWIGDFFGIGGSNGSN